MHMGHQRRSQLPTAASHVDATTMTTAAAMTKTPQSDAALVGGKQSHCPQTKTTMTMPATPATTTTHGRRLVCFRPRQRFSSTRPAAMASAEMSVCGCERRVLQCALGPATMPTTTTDDGATDSRPRRKWIERFEAHDWDKLEARVCQKWKDNELKYRRPVASSSATSASSPSSSPVKNAVRHALTSLEGHFLSSKFDGLLRAGIPPPLRGRIWWLCSGAGVKRARASAIESYPALIKRLPMLSKRATMEIEKDLPRTFSASGGAHGHDDPRQPPSVVRQSHVAELRRVLQAYCLRNPAIGYCQSMNFLAAVLLQHLEEEEAFWVLAVMLEELLPQYHTKSMLGSRAEQRVFAELVQQKLPALDAHLQLLGVHYEPLTLKWFLCLFLNTLPFEPALRIWDVFFCEGSHVLLRIGLTLLKLNQPRILACDDVIDVYEMFKFSHETLRDITAPHRAGLLNRDECVCDTLLRLALDKSFIGPIAFDTLHELRQLYRNEVTEEIRSRQELSAVSSSSSRSGMMITEVQRDDSEESETSEMGRARHAEAERELAEYDFIEEYSYHCGDVSPSKHIHFRDVFDCPDVHEHFVDVDYDGQWQAFAV